MRRLLTALLLLAPIAHAQQPAFEVATIHATDPGPKSSRILRIEGNNRFTATNFTLKLLIAAAYDLNPRAITGGPGWVDSQHFDITAITPGDTRPDHDQQMLMLRSLLTDRFHLAFHRTPKTFEIYEITVAKDGPKLKPSTAPADDPPKTVSVVYPDRLEMPAHNATVSDLARTMQRAILDRPVVDSTGLTARYDFTLTWAPDETQFGGEIPPPTQTNSPPLLVAMQQQLGLQMKATKGPIETLVIDKATQPTEN